MQSNQVSEYLTNNSKDMLELLIRVADINSGTFNVAGVQEVAEVLKDEFASLGCEQAIMPVDPLQIVNDKGDIENIPLGPVLRCWKRPDAPIQILLVGHMDTVFPKDHKFQKTTLLEEGKLSGPGVMDMKGGIVVMLYALRAFEQIVKEHNIGWEVILNPDEEISSRGSAEIIANHAKKHQMGFVFEPGMGEIGDLVGKRKGSGKFNLVMHGKAAHAGRNFDKGKNAIYRMGEVLKIINDLNGQREGVTINAGYIHGGGALNVVADCCVCKLDARVPHVHDADWVKNNLRQIADQVNKDSEYKLEVSGDFYRSPKEIDSETEKLYSLVQEVAKHQGFDLNIRPSGGVTDGNNLSAIGLPNVDTMGVRGEHMHSDREYMIISSLEERANLFANVLININENGFK